MFRLSDGEEILTLAFFVLIQYRSVSDRRTDGHLCSGYTSACIALYANALVKNCCSTMVFFLVGLWRCDVVTWNTQERVNNKDMHVCCMFVCLHLESWMRKQPFLLTRYWTTCFFVSRITNTRCRWKLTVRPSKALDEKPIPQPCDITCCVTWCMRLALSPFRRLVVCLPTPEGWKADFTWWLVT